MIIDGIKNYTLLKFTQEHIVINPIGKKDFLMGCQVPLAKGFKWESKRCKMVLSLMILWHMDN